MERGNAATYCESSSNKKLNQDYHKVVQPR